MCAGGDRFPVKTRSRRKVVRTAAPTPARAKLAVAGQVVTRGRRARGSFAKIPEILDVPDLIEVQRRSYEWFLREGIREVFEEVSPIQDFTGNLELHFALDTSRKRVEPPSAFEETPVLDFGGYRLERLRYSEEECRDRDYNYSAALKVKVRLVIKETGEKILKLYDGDAAIEATLTKDPVKERKGPKAIEEALIEIYRRLRPGDPPTVESARQLLQTLFFDPRRYDLGKVGRHKLNRKLGLEAPLPFRTLVQTTGGEVKDVSVRRDKKEFTLILKDGREYTGQLSRVTVRVDGEPIDIKKLEPGTRVVLGIAPPSREVLYVVAEEGVRHPAAVRDDIAEVVRYLIRLHNEEEGAAVDDIDHLGNRRVRSVGELLQNQFRIGMLRMERVVRERMTTQDVEAITPQTLINIRPVVAAIKEFFGTSQLSQFMDQTNPLAELTHKRRLSALGPGGLSRERAGFEVRDVHPSHYGRICPIETPEGPNIGLISSMSTFARINEFGFIETPYRKVQKGRVTDEIEYLTADREENFLVAQANAPVDGRGHFTGEKVSVRYRGDFLEVDPSKVNYMDVSPKQLVSVAAGLIPFLEHDDANRALMGSNMQRQGVPLIVSEMPLVGTGLEEKVARDSHAVVLAVDGGKVASVTADQIIVTKDGHLPESKKKVKTDSESGIYVYELRKFMRSNAGTCVNQKPIVRKGQHVKRGQVIADGPNTDRGELALGRNVLVAFMPWNGYNFEDAIMISEKVVKEDVYTSIHIDEFEIGARDTKLGPEEITRDIPNVSEEALRNLGPDGVVRVGAEVKPGDILVGKITPKSETELAPEERLLRAIFGEKAADVKDTSLKVPSGTYGIVMDVKVSAKKESDKSTSKVSPTEAKKHAKQIEDDHRSKTEELREQLTEALSNILLGEKIPLDVVNSETGEIIIPANRKITKTLLRKLASVYDRIEIDPSPIRNKINEIIGSFKKKFDDLQMAHDEEMERAESGDEVDVGIIKQVKVYIASKRKLSVGDKMAGRHGNKGVVAKIVPEEDMPFLADGTPVDLVLNPLGVPSRMNVGQVLETHLGWAARLLGLRFATPVFDGIKEKEIRGYLKEAKLPDNGKTHLYDGRTGEPFDQEIVVGYIYMMKLGHLVADKIHARAVGPYSLVTQQPLGGKAQYGGQRFGEMEVWAMEAYGAAYTLQELLTVKSDDVQGRTRIYESIVKGDNSLEAGIPESFNVLVKEMQSLGMDVKVGYSNPLDQPPQPSALTNLG